MKLPAHETSRSLKFEMTSMIDIVFLLLIFFLWTSSFDSPEFDLPGQLAKPPAGAETEAAPPEDIPMFDELIIGIEMAGDQPRFLVGDEAFVDRDALQQQLAGIVGLGAQPPVIIDPRPEVPIRHAVAAYDLARLAGLNDCLFAVPAPADAPRQ